MKSIHQEKVELFMKKAGQDVPDKPCIPDEKTRILRAKLIFEEAMETIEALGISIIPLMDKVRYVADLKPDLIKIADGCADIKVVTTGTLSACGLPDEEIQDTVDDANLRKFGPGYKIREDGKLIKPPDFQPPDLKSIIDGYS